MKNLSSIKHIYLLGIGGIGMSALARYFLSKGMDVCGYDKTSTTLTNELQQEGIGIHFDDDVNNLPAFVLGRNVNTSALVIFTPAIPIDNNEVIFLKERGYRLWKRSEILGLITAGSTTIAVAGTHGKTTTSTMIAHILRFNHINCTAFLGGISKNYNTNLLLGTGEPENTVMVVEADEYDRSFLTLHPDIAAVTSMDPDHLDIYGNHQAMIDSYQEFASQVKDDGALVMRAGLPLKKVSKKNFTYSIESPADFTAGNVRIKDAAYIFDIHHNDNVYHDFRMNWPGRHNMENALCAIAVCTVMGIEPDKIKIALDAFEGVKRRFDYQIRSEKLIYIDDYAHHPEELRATIESVKELYPSKKILGIFQPHLYSRTRDFAEGFARSLSLLDELILLDIYPARELPVRGVTSNLILDKVTIPFKKLCSRENLPEAIMKSDATVILTLGAGDIDQLVDSIRILLNEKHLKQNTI